MTSGPIGKFLACMSLWLTLLATAGCDVSMPTPSSAPQGEVRTEKLKTNLSAEEARALAQPASSTQGLSVDVQGAQNLGMGSENFDGTMQPSRGLNTQRLFSTSAGSEDERFERLEAAVQKLRDDFDAVNPAINRLIAIESEIQMLVDQLQVLVQDDSSANTQNIPPVAAETLADEMEFPAEQNPAPSPPIPLAPPLIPETAAPVVPMAAPAAAPAPAPSAVTSGAALLNMRAADNPGTTRVVFETTQKIPYTVDVDPEKILIVTFKEGESKANLSASLKSSLIKSADVTPQASGGFILAMPLSKMTKIVRQGVLNPDASNAYYRIYIDLER